MPPTETPVPVPTAVAVPVDPSSSLWDRISSWVSENKTVVYTVAGVGIFVTGAGVIYYMSSDTGANATPKLSKKERRKKKEAERKAEAERSAAAEKAKTPTVEDEDDIPEITETSLAAMSPDQRNTYAARLKDTGNAAYKKNQFDKAIDLYSKAIMCKQDPVYYSNRAACWSARKEYEKVVEDATAALNLDWQYVKALNRRATAFEHLEMYSEALLDFTASCIIGDFKNEKTAKSVEELLRKVAQLKAKQVMDKRGSKLPSSTFVGNYLQSFRQKPRPEGLEDSVDLPENTGKGQLQLGLRCLEQKTGEGYDQAGIAFEKALELGDLGEHEALAYNMRGTWKCLLGKHEEALEDLAKSIELEPSMTQSYVKRASIHLELGAPEAAAEDFEKALEKNKNDPDIYYHRAQLHFIQNQFSEAAQDYQKSIDLDRDFIFSHIQLGVTQYKMGSLASSMATFRRCVKNFDSSPEVYNYYGELLMDQGNFDEAISRFETAMEMEKQNKPMNMNVLPIINKALSLVQWKQDFVEAEKLCQKALIIDPDCDIAVATMAQLLLQQGKVMDALKYFERAAELARTPEECVNALSYAEATRTQVEIQSRYPQLKAKLEGMASGQAAFMPS